MDGLRFFISPVGSHLDTDNAVSGLSHEPAKGLMGADQDHVAIGSSVVGKRIVGHHSGDLHRTAAQGHLISNGQGNVFVPDTQHMALIFVDLF